MQLKSFKLHTKKPWPYVLGLDISFEALKYLLLRRTSRGLKVEGFGRYAFENDETDYTDKIRQGLKSLFQKRNAFKQAKIILGVDSSRLAIKKESLPALSRKELLQTLSFGIEEAIQGEGGEADAVVFDYQELGPDPGKPDYTQYLTIGMPESVIDEWIHYFVDEGVVPTKVTPTVISMINLVQISSELRKRNLIGILDIGSQQSMLAIVRQGKMDFFREISIGGNDFTKSIIGTIFHEGRAIQFTEDDATEFKYRYGYSLGFSEGMMFKGAPLTEVGTMMRPVVERLSGEIHRSIGFYKDQSADGEVEMLYLIGGGAKLKHLSDVLTKRVGIPVSIFPFPEELRISGGKKNQETFRKKFLGQAISLSLAMEASLKGNLLPDSYKKIHHMTFIKRSLQYTAVAAAIIIAFLTVHFQNRIRSLKSQVATKEVLVSRIEDRNVIFTALQSQKLILEREISRLNLHIQQDNTLVQVLRLISHAVPSHLRFSSFEYGLERERTSRENQSKLVEDAQWIIHIYGASTEPPNDVGIHMLQLIIELEKSNYFSDIELVNDLFSPDGDEYQFELIGYLNKE